MLEYCEFRELNDDVLRECGGFLCKDRDITEFFTREYADYAYPVSYTHLIDLLRQLAIPQININLVDNAVTTPSGQNVAVYINYIPASAEEKMCIRDRM